MIALEVAYMYVSFPFTNALIAKLVLNAREPTC